MSFSKPNFQQQFDRIGSRCGSEEDECCVKGSNYKLGK